MYMCVYSACLYFSYTIPKILEFSKQSGICPDSRFLHKLQIPHLQAVTSISSWSKYILFVYYTFKFYQLQEPLYFEDWWRIFHCQILEYGTRTRISTQSVKLAKLLGVMPVCVCVYVHVNAKILHIEASRVFVCVEIRFGISFLKMGLGLMIEIVFQYLFLFFILQRD